MRTGMRMGLSHRGAIGSSLMAKADLLVLPIALSTCYDYPAEAG